MRRDDWLAAALADLVEDEQPSGDVRARVSQAIDLQDRCTSEPEWPTTAAGTTPARQFGGAAGSHARRGSGAPAKIAASVAATVLAVLFAGELIERAARTTGESAEVPGALERTRRMPDRDAPVPVRLPAAYCCESPPSPPPLPPGSFDADRRFRASPGDELEVHLLGYRGEAGGLTLLSVTGLLEGTLHCVASGACVYEAPDQPPADGRDSFEFSAGDGSGRRSTGVVTIEFPAAVPVAAPPGGPLHASDDFVPAAPGATVAVDLLANDVVTPEELAGVAVTRAPTNGVAACDTGGACTYTSAPGFVGDDDFVYEIRLDDGRTATARVRIRVQPPS